MNAITPIVLGAWIPVVLALFALLPTRRAVIASFLVAWSFLPVAGFAFKGLPDYTKMSATVGGVLLGALIFDMGRVTQLRLRWFDLPVIILCLVPFASSLSNGLGAYDGMSVSLDYIIRWGLPYFIGRLYLTDREGLRELAIGIFFAGLIYIPLCAYEMRMSPQLHNMLYGWVPSGFQNVRRLGGWRPIVFMSSPLMLSAWMCMTALVGFWLWWTGAIKRIRNVPMRWLAIPLIIAALLCRSFGAMLLLAMGMGALWWTRQFASRLALVALLLIPPGYMLARATGTWQGGGVADFARMVSPPRAESFLFRLKHEKMIIDKALRKPIAGWGGWGRWRVKNEEGKDITVSDGLWAIYFGKHGLLGLGALYTMLLMPLGFILWKVRPASLARPEIAPPLALAVMVTLFAIDCLPNAFPIPIYALAAGSVTGGFGLMKARTTQLIHEIPGDRPLGG